MTFKKTVLHFRKISEDRQNQQRCARSARHRRSEHRLFVFYGRIRFQVLLPEMAKEISVEAGQRKFL